jgi:hypothetical protein
MAMQVLRRLCLIFFLLPTLSYATPSNGLVGTGWCARTDANTFQAFELSQDHGKRLFQEWLHARPGMTGSWRLDGDKLYIRASGVAFSFVVISVSPTKLVLAVKGGRREAYYTSRCAVEQDDFRP